jgi:hypothetical protein
MIKGGGKHDVHATDSPFLMSTLLSSHARQAHCCRPGKQGRVNKIIITWQQSTAGAASICAINTLACARQTPISNSKHGCSLMIFIDHTLARSRKCTHTHAGLILLQ